MINGKSLKKTDAFVLEPNTHKYQLKSRAEGLDELCKADGVNVSRSIGNSGHWIGCGFIDKTGIENDHHEIIFPFYSLVYVVKGEGEYIDEDQNSHALEPGCLFQRRPGKKHTTVINSHTPWHEYYIDFNTEYYHHLAGLGLIEASTPVYRISPDQTITETLQSLMDELNSSVESRLPDTALNFVNQVRNLINQSNLHRLKEASGSDGTPLSHTEQARIEKSCLDFNRLMDRRIDLKEYCRKNGWGYESFRKAFKRQIGISPGQYIVRIRMDEACRLLRSTPMRISEISAGLGYKSQYEFSNQFKRRFGVFPTRFRDGR